MTIENLLAVLDYAGVATFAARAALAVASRGTDLVATVVLALVAAVGGGTTRDVLIGAPVFWLSDPAYLYVGFGVGTLAWMSGLRGRHRLTLDLLDALGIGAYAVVGTLKALLFHANMPAAIVVGVIAATGGGLMREVLAGEPTVLSRKEVYVTAALVGPVLLATLLRCGMGRTPASFIAAAAGVLVRATAILAKLEMPERAGRHRR